MSGLPDRNFTCKVTCKKKQSDENKTTEQHNQVLLKTMRVKIRNGSQTKTAVAFLNEGATVFLINEDIVSLMT